MSQKGNEMIEAGSETEEAVCKHAEAAETSVEMETETTRDSTTFRPTEMVRFYHRLKMQLGYSEGKVGKSRNSK